jgi:hypothetical protein
MPYCLVLVPCCLVKYSVLATSLTRQSMTMTAAVLRKVDRRLIPLLFTTYMLSFMDKTILSSASVFGLIEDTVRPQSRVVPLITSI